MGIAATAQVPVIMLASAFFALDSSTAAAQSLRSSRLYSNNSHRTCGPSQLWPAPGVDTGITNALESIATVGPAWTISETSTLGRSSRSVQVYDSPQAAAFQDSLARARDLLEQGQYRDLEAAARRLVVALQVADPVDSLRVADALDGDLSHDSKPDLAVTNYVFATVSILLGNGNDTFGPKTNYGTEFGPTSVAIGDMSGDGKPDMAVANGYSNTNTVSMLLGNVTARSGPRRTTARGALLIPS